ncbi:MAG: hypothetical protein LBB13_01255 [Rickettsiales bacterium]|jgi:hypothetical protein|nr:hypothetical protein [Rickettsiales bacterium]
MAVNIAGPIRVRDLGELQRAISGKEKEIVIEGAIDFITDGLAVNYGVVVSGQQSKNAPGLLNGRGKCRFFTFEENAENILLRNLHLNNGNNMDKPSALSGVGAINLAEESSETFSGKKEPQLDQIEWFFILALF